MQRFTARAVVVGDRAGTVVPDAVVDVDDGEIRWGGPAADAPPAPAPQPGAPPGAGRPAGGAPGRLAAGAGKQPLPRAEGAVPRAGGGPAAGPLAARGD